MQINIDIKPSFKDVGRAIGSVKIASFIREEINRLAFSVERFSKQLTPVDTGRLRASIFTSPATMSGLQATISTNTEYAIFVHEGTRYMRPRPFMKTGAMFAQESELKDINVRLDQEFIKAFKTL